MIITTTDFIPNKKVEEVLGIARGKYSRIRNVGRDIFVGLKTIVGGEISEYTKLQLMRESSYNKNERRCLSMGADAIINVRLTTAMIIKLLLRY